MIAINELGDDINHHIRLYQEKLMIDVQIFNYHNKTLNKNRNCHKSLLFYIVIYIRWIMSFQMGCVKQLLKDALGLYCNSCYHRDLIKEALRAGSFNYKYWVLEVGTPFRSWQVWIGCNFWRFWSWTSLSVIRCLITDPGESVVIGKIVLEGNKEVFKVPNDDSVFIEMISGEVNISGYRNGWAKCQNGFIKFGQMDKIYVDNTHKKTCFIDY